ncbi:hypothetical protein ON010_g14434 [Phytophthora cinnamomi]|nr:hypothetical protein ON010_g14434 [Phytophthora cinnamomi]
MKFTLGLVLTAVAITSTIADDNGEDSCDFLCPEQFDPVTDENGVEYSNKCFMKLAKCGGTGGDSENPTTDAQRKLAFAPGCKGGASIPAPSPTPSPKTSSSKNSTGEDSCDFVCPEQFDPVTDENGVEYSNECFMKLAKCEGTSGDGNEEP